MSDQLHSVRAALALAISEQRSVIVTLRGDPTRGLAAREIEGVPRELGASADGRERVFMGVAEDTEQVLLVDRIAQVRNVR